MRAPEAASRRLLAQSQAAQPEPSFLLVSTESKVKMSNPAGQGLGEAGAEVIHSGWEEVDPGECCPELRQWLFVRFP